MKFVVLLVIDKSFFRIPMVGSEQPKLDDRIDSFWRWFTAHADAIELFAESSDVAGVVKLVDPRIRRLSADISWEVGPGLESAWSFVLSPNGARERLSVTRQIVAQAPSLPRWEFHWAKPPKQWDFRFDVRGQHGQTISVDASGWKYSLVAYDNRRFFDISLIAPGFQDLGAEALLQVGYLVVEGAIGEELALERIGRITVLRELPAERRVREGLSSLQDLRPHLRLLLLGR